MRVAIIGYSGAGKTTLANALAGQFGVPPALSLNEARTCLEQGTALVLDGIPRTLDELLRLDANAPGDARIEHVLWLRAPHEIRVRRITERITGRIIAGGGPAESRPQALHAADLQQVRKYLESSGRLITIDASGSRSDVLARALDALGVRF